MISLSIQFPALSTFLGLLTTTLRGKSAAAFGACDPNFPAIFLGCALSRQQTENSARSTHFYLARLDN
jgi:hypothetical protein